jgi:lipid A 4'-phosphatase
MKVRTILKSQAFKDFSIVILILGITTVIFHVTSLDIIIQRFFYSDAKGWVIQTKGFWDIIYRYGIFPGYLLAIIGLIMISVSYWRVQYVKYRRSALLLVFTMMLGPGLFVNAIFKDHWGRPRPRDIKEFGGTETYVCPCVKGSSPEGKSFPCGHCSMGFFLAVPYLIYRKRRKIIAATFLVAGFSWGTVIGISRMMAGGHFPSDVVWAAGMVWITALIGFYLFRPDKSVAIASNSSPEKNKKQARIVTLLVGIMLPVITLATVLATPYISKKNFILTNAIRSTIPSHAIIADLKDATVEISNDTCFKVDYKVNAFGFPNSKVRGNWLEGDTGSFKIQFMGWFTEVKNVIAMKIPMKEVQQYIIRLNKGKVVCSLPDSLKASLSFTLKKGNIYLKLNGNDVTFIGDRTRFVNKSGKNVKIDQVLPGSSGVYIKYNLANGLMYVE